MLMTEPQRCAATVFQSERNIVAVEPFPSTLRDYYIKNEFVRSQQVLHPPHTCLLWALRWPYTQANDCFLHLQQCAFLIWKAIWGTSDCIIPEKQKCLGIISCIHSFISQMSQPDVLLLVQECLKNSGKAKFFHILLLILSSVYKFEYILLPNYKQEVHFSVGTTQNKNKSKCP